jgi:demethylmenaquinone methyltransferase/2-methoxy-6-polyprenyl-1,4-benzoquinol methylase
VCGARAPVTDPEKEPARIRAMFDAVAPRYDLLNRLLSAGIDVRWRRRAIRALDLRPGNLLLDLCTGTGDLGYEALRQVPGVRVVGTDLARNMLVRGRKKGEGRKNGPRFVQGDVLELPLPDASADGVSVGFGIRNVASLERAILETARVLRPGGRFVVLEFTLPPQPLLRALYRAYFHRVLPRVGGWISGRPDAYTYLPDSVERFPRPEALARRMREAGFADVTWTLLSGGIAALHVAVR